MELNAPPASSQQAQLPLALFALESNSKCLAAVGMAGEVVGRREENSSPAAGQRSSRRRRRPRTTPPPPPPPPRQVQSHKSRDTARGSCGGVLIFIEADWKEGIEFEFKEERYVHAGRK